MYCKNCGTEINSNQSVCVKCGVKVGDGKKFCLNCGKELNEGADVCLNCGSSTKKTANGYLNGQDKTIMFIIALLAGGIGIHNFMLGETKKGIIKIVASFCCGIGAILAIIDAIKIITDSYVIDTEKYF